MKDINDYLDAYAEACGVNSDYAIAKNLGVTKQSVSKYRNDRAYPDFDTAWRLADGIGCDASEIMVAAEIARAVRAHNVTLVRVWQKRLAQIAGAFLLVFCGFFWSQPAAASTPQAVSEARTMYIMLNILRVYLWHFAIIARTRFSGYFAPKKPLF